MSLTNKVATVTGAAQGLGHAFSEILLKNAAKVMLSDVNEANGQKTLSELGAKYGKDKVDFIKCDVRSQKDVEAMFAKTKSKFGGINIVINNAGFGDELDRWESTVDINVKGVMICTTTAMDHLRNDKGGKGGVIVNIGSFAGLHPNPCAPVYSATKAAIIMFSRCWAINPDAANHGVRVNVLAPAFAETPLVDNLKKGVGVRHPEIAAKIVGASKPMKVEEVAAALLDLITDESKTNAVLKLTTQNGKEYV